MCQFRTRFSGRGHLKPGAIVLRKPDRRADLVLRLLALETDS
jgi:hypothetical protein